MATLKALSPATRTSTDFGLWGTVVASVAKSVLHPNELHDVKSADNGTVLACGMLIIVTLLASFVDMFRLWNTWNPQKLPAPGPSSVIGLEQVSYNTHKQPGATQ